MKETLKQTKPDARNINPSSGDLSEFLVLYMGATRTPLNWLDVFDHNRRRVSLADCDELLQFPSCQITLQPSAEEIDNSRHDQPRVGSAWPLEQYLKVCHGEHLKQKNIRKSRI